MTSPSHCSGRSPDINNIDWLEIVRAAKKNETPLAVVREKAMPDVGQMRESLEKAKDEGRLWIDWTKLASSVEEFHSLQDHICCGDTKFVNNFCLPLVLCGPVPNLIVSEEYPTGSVPQKGAYEDEMPEQNRPDSPETSDSDEDEFVYERPGMDWDSNFNYYLPTMSYRYLGEWKADDVVGNFEQELFQVYEDASWSTKFRAVECFGERAEVSPSTEYFQLQSGLTRNSLDSVASILAMTDEATGVVKELAGCNIVGGSNVRYARDCPADCTVVIYKDGKYPQPILPVVLELPAGDRLIPCVRWEYYLRAGGEAPTEIPKPSNLEMSRAVTVMTRILASCLLYGLEEVVVSDCRSATAIRFEFDTVDKDKSRGCLGFRSITTYCDSVGLPMTFMFTAMAWRQYREFRNGQHQETREIVKRAAQKLRLPTEQLIKDTTLVEGGSVISQEIGDIELEAIQDSDYLLNRVFRIRHYSHLFPKVVGETAILKVLELSNIETHFVHNQSSLWDFTYGKFKRYARDQFHVELECYKRIAEFNKTAKRPIHAPKLLDYGVCCVDDENDIVLDGRYIIIEDLGGHTFDDTREDDPESLIVEDIKLLKSIGINHRDIEWRNLIEKDGVVYLIDFNQAELDK